MPAVRNLTAQTAAPVNYAPPMPSSTQPKPAPLPSNPTPTGVATIIEANDALPQAALTLRMPSFLETLPQNTAANVLPEPTGTYVGCYESQADAAKIQAYRAAGIQEGDYFVSAEGRLIPCNPLKFFVVSAQYLLSFMDSMGRIQRVSFDPNSPDKTLGDHFLTLLLVDIGDRLIPVKGEFRTTKCQSIAPAIKEIEKAAEPEWLNGGAAHKLAAQVPLVWGRVFATAYTQPAVSKSSGNPYKRGVSQVGPVPTDAMLKLGAFWDDEACMKSLDEVSQQFKGRLAELKQIAGVK